MLARVPVSISRELDAICDIILELPQQQRGIVIGLTGAEAGSGTTTVCALLATMLAEKLLVSNSDRLPVANGFDAGAVLALDAQVINPGLAAMWDARPGPGLLDSLKDMQRIDGLVQSIDDNLDLLSFGEDTEPAATALSTTSMERLFDELRARYGFVIVDLPAAVESTKALRIASLCDGVLLVVHAGVTSAPAIERACFELERAKIDVVGGILNRQRVQVPKLLSRWL